MSNEGIPLLGRSNNGGSSILNFNRELFTILVVFVLILVLSAMYEMAFVVPPGYVGVVVTLGHVKSFPSGLHYKLPFVSELVTMSTKTQLLEEKNVVPTKEGLSVTLDTAVLYRLESEKAADVYRDIGPDYSDLLIKPEAASAIRGLTSESEAKALYSSGRNMIQDTVKTELTAKLASRGIIIQDVLLKDLELPQQLTEAIEQKLRAEQASEQMEFVLKKEQQEADRKAIEAGGIADFQRIVSEGISPMLLKWKGVEATEKFANAPNTKIVIMGNDSSGLPVILNADND